MIKKQSVSLLYMVVSFLFSLVITCVGTAYADCNCSVGSNGISIIGKVYQSNSCPTEGGSYVYDEYLIECSGGNLSAWLVGQQDFYSGTPEQIIQNRTGSRDIILRNPDGTNLIVVQATSYPFNGMISGFNTAGTSPGVYNTDPQEKLNQYCFNFNMPDQDGDDFPDCLDCAPDDATTSYECEEDNCPADPDKTEPGICGCGVPDVYTDNNEIMECQLCNNCGPPC